MFLLGSARNNVDVVMATGAPIEPQFVETVRFGAGLVWVICVSNRLYNDIKVGEPLQTQPCQLVALLWCQDLLGGEQEDPARTSFRSCHG